MVKKYEKDLKEKSPIQFKEINFGGIIIKMKRLLLTTIAAVVLVGCATTQSLELKTEKSSYFIGIYDAAYQGNIEAIKKYIAYNQP